MRTGHDYAAKHPNCLQKTLNWKYVGLARAEPSDVRTEFNERAGAATLRALPSLATRSDH